MCVCVCVQRLLKHPELSNSQLLADFLSPHSEESQFLDKTLADVRLGTIISYNLPDWSDLLLFHGLMVGFDLRCLALFCRSTGKIFKSVPGKLIKEVSCTRPPSGPVSSSHHANLSDLLLSREDRTWSPSSSPSSTPVSPPSPSPADLN